MATHSTAVVCVALLSLLAISAYDPKDDTDILDELGALGDMPPPGSPQFGEYYAKLKDKLGLQGDWNDYQSAIDEEQKELDMLIKMKKQQTDMMKKIKGVDDQIAGLQKVYDLLASAQGDDPEEILRKIELAKNDEMLTNALNDMMPGGDDWPDLSEYDEVLDKLQRGTEDAWDGLDMDFLDKIKGQGTPEFDLGDLSSMLDKYEEMARARDKDEL